jgi:hypothetical protein
MKYVEPQSDATGKNAQPPKAEGDQFHQGWRQVRVFCSNYNQPNWYPNFLGTVLKPIFGTDSKTVFFTTRYICLLGGDDDGDCNISNLPAEFLPARPDGKRIHFSIRVRFKPQANEEELLSATVKGMAHLWFSDFLAFSMPGGLAGDRFATDQDKDSQERRGRLVAELLYANSRFLLDSLVLNGEQWSFQQNTHALNKPCGLAVQSALHMIVNPWGLNNSVPLPIFVQLNDTAFRPL